MSAPSVAQSEDVQDLGQLSPDEIGRKLDALAIREAEATRIALECRVERAKLLRQVQDEHGFKGRQYVEFARRYGGASRTDAYDMLLLTEADDDVLAPHGDPYSEYPHWRTVWRAIKHRLEPPDDCYCITPPELEELIREESGGSYYDPCPYPCPPDHDALEDDWAAHGKPCYVNAPYSSRHEKKGRGMTAFGRKVIEEVKKGTEIRMVVPVWSLITQLLEADPSSVRSLGRVPWLHATTGERMPQPVPCMLFTFATDRWPSWNLNYRPDAKVMLANDNHRTEEHDVHT